MEKGQNDKKSTNTESELKLLKDHISVDSSQIKSIWTSISGALFSLIIGLFIAYSSGKVGDNLTQIIPIILYFIAFLLLLLIYFHQTYEYYNTISLLFTTVWFKTPVKLPECLKLYSELKSHFKDSKSPLAKYIENRTKSKMSQYSFWFCLFVGLIVPLSLYMIFLIIIQPENIFMLILLILNSISYIGSLWILYKSKSSRIKLVKLAFVVIFPLEFNSIDEFWEERGNTIIKKYNLEKY